MRHWLIASVFLGSCATVWVTVITAALTCLAYIGYVFIVVGDAGPDSQAGV